MKFKKGIITAKCAREGEVYDQQFDGIIKDGLGIHKSLGRDEFTITHLRSGLSVCFCEKQNEARTKVERLLQITDWTKEIVMYGELREKVREATQSN